MTFEISVEGIGDNKPISPEFAFCTKDGNGKVKDGGNINPAMSWKNAPADTKSFALIIVDPDVPASFDNANQDGKTIAKDAPRQNFYHWVLVDIPLNVSNIPKGKVSNDKTDKPVGKTPYGITGKNSYSMMGGTHGGYDGPCPPWNDERVHHYHFQIYALDTESLGLSGEFNGRDAMKEIAKHTLAMAEVIGTYTTKQ